jgi:vancomycin permeability regulator SanA
MTLSLSFCWRGDEQDEVVSMDATEQKAGFFVKQIAVDCAAFHQFDSVLPTPPFGMQILQFGV